MNPVAVLVLLASLGTTKPPPLEWSCYDKPYGCGCFLRPEPSNGMVCSANARCCLAVVDTLFKPTARACLCYEDADQCLEDLDRMRREPQTKVRRVERCPQGYSSPTLRLWNKIS